MACPEFNQLIQHAEGELDAVETKRVEAHLRSCSDCERSLVWYREMAATASSDTTFDPPSWVTAKAVDLFKDAREAAARRGIRGLVARIVASLVFDSASGSPLAGDAIPARSAVAAGRQLLFTAGPYDIDLLVAREANGSTLSITGQLLSSDSDAFEGVSGLGVELVQSGATVQSEKSTEFGEFTLEGVRPGTYTIRLVNPSREIALPPIAIGAE